VTDALTLTWFRKKPAPGPAPLRPGQPVCPPGLPGQVQGLRHDFLDEPERQWPEKQAKRRFASRQASGRSPAQHVDGSGFKRFRNEQVHGVPYASHADMKAASFEYIEVFSNRKRLHSTLGYQSPVQFLENWIRQHPQENLLA
jgi:putative transposase